MAHYSRKVLQEERYSVIEKIGLAVSLESSALILQVYGCIKNTSADAPMGVVR